MVQEAGVYVEDVVGWLMLTIGLGRGVGRVCFGGVGVSGGSVMQNQKLGNSKTAIPYSLDIAFIRGGNCFFNLQKGVSQECAAFCCSLGTVASQMPNRKRNILENGIRAHVGAVSGVNVVGISDMQRRSGTIHFPRRLSFRVGPAGDVRRVRQQS